MLCVVPARGGSKRLPGKNLRSVGGIPLIDRTLSAALESGVFSDIVFSSDDQQALDMAGRFDVQLHRRPAELAQDSSRSLDVAAHLLREDRYSHHDTVMVLFVTCPFRTAGHIRQAADVLKAGFDSVLTIAAMPQPAQFCLTKNGDTVEPWISYDFFRKTTQKQALAPLFFPTFAIQGSTRDVIFRYNGFVGDKCGYVEMTAEEATDIDTESDIAMAEYYVEKGLCS